MSTGNPGDGLGDRPKMAEALASLKEGLSEKDDPLYDGWKLHKGAGDAAGNLAAVGEAQAKADGTDTVPVRVVRYLVFPKWAIVLAAALVAFAAMVTVVRLTFRTSAMASAASTSTRAVDSPSFKEIEPVSGPLDPPNAALSNTSAGDAPAMSAPTPHKVKGKKGKTQDPGFFHDPGF